MKNEKIIYSNFYEDIFGNGNKEEYKEAFKEYLECNNYSKEEIEEKLNSEEELDNYIYEDNNNWLDCERDNLGSIKYNQRIIVIAYLGLWYGRRQAYKFINSGKVRDCLSDDCDYVKWYVDRYNNFRAVASHHDGRNYYLYRVVNCSERQLEKLCDKLYNGKATMKDISRYTKSIGKDIGKVYGWN